MKIMVARLLRDARGSSSVEFALSAGILLVMLIGIAQVGILFMANAGLQHAVAEGARYATIYPTPSDTQLISKVNTKRFGLNATYLTGPTVTHGVDDGSKYTEVTMSYAVPLNFIFFQAPAVTLTETRRSFVY
jgi:Flp pilus assembly protein TadG